MAVNERRLSGRDVLAKTFQARTKRGYDPVEVDAYLELIAAQIDMLHGDITRAREGEATGEISRDPLDGRLDALAAELDAVAAERDSFRAERDSLDVLVEELSSEREAAIAENQQLRAQVASVAPPPPGAHVEDAVEMSGVIDVDATEAETLPAALGDERAMEESYELVLRMARRSAEETIAEAHARADEIVADANFTAAQISRESDRKAFEAANKVQAELSLIAEEVEQRKFDLDRLESLSDGRREAMRELASQLLVIAEDDGRALTEGDQEVVDIRPSSDSVI